MFEKRKTFLAIDIENGFVRGFGLSSDGQAVDTHFYSESGLSTRNNIMNVVDTIEQKLGINFKEVYVTGNFGIVETITGENETVFKSVHKITNADVYNTICSSSKLQDINKKTLHLIPLQFLINDEFEIRDTTNAIGSNLSVRFNCITYPDEIITEIKEDFLSIGLRPAGFFDPIYALGQRYHRSKKTEVFIDFEKNKTLVGVYKDRGLVERFDIDTGQNETTKTLVDCFGIKCEEAERIEQLIQAWDPSSSDQYVVADEKNQAITKADVWDAWMNTNNKIIDTIFEKVNLENIDLFISGYGQNPENIKRLILKNKELNEITVLDEFAIVGAIGNMFKENFVIKNPSNQTVTKAKTVPIIPSVMVWDVKNSYIYKMFESVGIKRLHCDVMDGFYTTNIMGTLEDLKKVRSSTLLYLQAHLMVEDPAVWINDVANAGADTIILSSGSRRIIESLAKIKKLGKKAGLALHPDFDLKKLKPEILRMLDEIIVMTVYPGKSGQTFIPEMLKKIKVLKNTKIQYKFNYKIIADGGINEVNAKDCWANGCDFLISGSFLKNAPDFREAVRKLLPRR